MASKSIPITAQRSQSRSYLSVVRLEDGRYRVEFLKDSQSPRTSYARHAEDVVQQARRAGNIPLLTTDSELRRACENQQVPLLNEPLWDLPEHLTPQ